MTKSMVELAAQIIRSQCNQQNMGQDDINQALQSTFNTLQALQAAEAGGQTTISVAPDLSPKQSIQQNEVICLECGMRCKVLTEKHLLTHGLTGREYRIKHGFKLTQPLMSEYLTEKRKKAGKKRGLPENLRKSLESRKKKAVKNETLAKRIGAVRKRGAKKK